MKRIGCLIVVLVAAESCTAVCACPPSLPATALVWGQVTDSGLPRSNATMLVAVRDPGSACVPGAMTERGTNDAQGRFRIVLFREVPVDSVCVFVGARLGAGNSAQYAVRGPVWLSFRYEQPFDSANVNFAFP